MVFSLAESRAWLQTPKKESPEIPVRGAQTPGADKGAVKHPCLKEAEMHQGSLAELNQLC